MKAAAILTMTVLAGISTNLAEAKPAPVRKLAVCVLQEGPFVAMGPALMTASRLFREAGVAIEWAIGGSCPPDRIRILLSHNTPDTLYPGALAYALPFEGTQVQVFLDRIEECSPSLVPHLLGYVLAHEVTHVIQGTDRHSDHGVMKAHWDGRDISQMQWDELRFADRDVHLMLIGLDKRTQAARSPAKIAAIPAFVTVLR